MTNNKPVCVIAGAGAGNGAAFAKKFLLQDYRVVLLARSLEKLTELDFSDPELKDKEKPVLMSCDLTEEQTVINTVAQIETELGPVETLIYNAGNAVLDRVDGTNLTTLQDAWKVNCQGLYTFSNALIPTMKQQGKGNIIIIGATASLRGKPGFFSFCSAKAAQKSMAESMAKTLGPENIHVSYVIVDGVIDMPMARGFFSNKADDFFLDPNAIADSIWHLSQQKKSAWTFMLDVRPFQEEW